MDMSIEKTDRFTNLLLALLLIILALTVLTQANPGTRLPGRDYGFYIYIGDQILHGRLPYRDAWESKPPAIFYLNGLALRIGRGSRWGVWLVELASLLVASALSYRVLKKLWGIWPALAGLIVWLSALDRTLEGGNLTEEYPLPLHFLSFMLFLKLIESPRQRIFNLLLGLAFGISFLFRPNNAIVEAAVIVVLLIVQVIRREIRGVLNQSLWLAFGTLVPILITGLYFWSQGLLTELLEASLSYNFAYSSTSITSSSPLLTGLGLFGWVAWVAVIGYLIALFQLFKTRGPVYSLVLIGLPLAIFLSDPARRNYAHYFINWIPFIGLLAGLTLHFLTTNLPLPAKESLRSERIALGLTLLLVLIFVMFVSLLAISLLFTTELENFDGEPDRMSDQTDASSGAFACLTNIKRAGTWGRR